MDIKNGVVEHDDISFLPEEFRPQKYLDFLKEDMLLIRLYNDILVDVGWRPSFDEDGEFNVVAVRSENWDEPISVTVTRDILGVKAALKKIVNDFA